MAGSRVRLVLLVAALLAVLAVTVAGATGARRSPHPAEVVAAEDVWGSIARQLAGSKLTVTSIVDDANVDPHDYDPTTGDARTIAAARLAIVNGIGYDPWASKLLAADPASGRQVLDVGDVLGAGAGSNPHQWYDPASVRAVTDAIVVDYDRLDPHDSAYFAAQKARFENVSLATYDGLRAEIRRRFAGVPVGYSESIFEPLGRDLHLDLLTPYGFAKAVAEGTDISAGDKETVDRQVRRHRIDVWVVNSQNATPDVRRIDELCLREHIPIARVTETPAPASRSFEAWQVGELRGLIAALHRATGR